MERNAGGVTFRASRTIRVRVASVHARACAAGQSARIENTMTRARRGGMGGF